MGNQYKHCNVGGTDRILRFAFGFGLLGAAWLGRDLSKWTRIGLLAVEAESLYSAATRHCPLSELLGLTSCNVPLLDETLAGQVDERYPEMAAEGYDERAERSTAEISPGLS
jgi:hypothetical protein